MPRLIWSVQEQVTRIRSTLEPHQIDHEHFTRFRKQLGAMDPNTKLILDELKSVQSNLTSRIDAVEHSIVARVGSLEDAAKVFNAWKPNMDASAAELRAKIGAFR